MEFATDSNVHRHHVSIEEFHGIHGYIVQLSLWKGGRERDGFIVALMFMSNFPFFLVSEHLLQLTTTD